MSDKYKLNFDLNDMIDVPNIMDEAIKNLSKEHIKKKEDLITYALTVKLGNDFRLWEILTGKRVIIEQNWKTKTEVFKLDGEELITFFPPTYEQKGNEIISKQPYQLHVGDKDQCLPSTLDH